MNFLKKAADPKCEKCSGKGKLFIVYEDDKESEGLIDCSCTQMLPSEWIKKRAEEYEKEETSGYVTARYLIVAVLDFLDAAYSPDSHE